MASISESGYEKSVANFKEVVDLCMSYGDKYKPQKTSIGITELLRLHGDAMDSLQRVLDAQKEFKIAKHQRDEAFKNVKSLAGRVVNALLATDTLRQTVVDARSIKAKLDGRRVKAVSPEPVMAADGETETPARRSVSQQSFDMLIAHLNNLITLVVKDKVYAPNEEELKVESLSAFVANLRELNSKAVRASNTLSAARAARDRVFSQEGTGLKDITMAVKAYVKSVFGNTSNEVKNMSRIKV